MFGEVQYLLMRLKGAAMGSALLVLFFLIEKGLYRPEDHYIILYFFFIKVIKIVKLFYLIL